MGALAAVDVVGQIDGEALDRGGRHRDLIRQGADVAVLEICLEAAYHSGRRDAAVLHQYVENDLARVRAGGFHAADVRVVCPAPVDIGIIGSGHAVAGRGEEYPLREAGVRFQIGAAAGGVRVRHGGDVGHGVHEDVQLSSREGVPGNADLGAFRLNINGQAADGNLPVFEGLEIDALPVGDAGPCRDAHGVGFDLRQSEADRSGCRCGLLPGNATPCGEVVQIVAIAVFQKVLFPGPLHVLLDLVEVQRHGVYEDSHGVGGCEADLFPGQFFVAGLVVGNQPGLHILQLVVVGEGNVRQIENRLQGVSHL